MSAGDISYMQQKQTSADLRKKEMERKGEADGGGKEEEVVRRS